MSRCVQFSFSLLSKGLRRIGEKAESSAYPESTCPIRQSAVTILRSSAIIRMCSSADQPSRWTFPRSRTDRARAAARIHINPGSDDTLFSSCVHTAETVFFECSRVDGRLRDLQDCIRGRNLPGFLVLHRMGQPCLLCRQEAGRYPDFRAKKLGIKNKRHKDTVRCIPCAFSDAGRPEPGIGPYRHLEQGLYPAEIPVSCFKVLERDPSL